IEQYRVKVQRMRPSEAAIKALSVNYAVLLKEKEAETDREAGHNNGVSDKQIRLKIYSPNVLDITLVDFPGITKVPVGDQPSDIEAIIRTMTLSYIKHPSCGYTCKLRFGKIGCTANSRCCLS
ncbi:Dynamin, partial [Thalictrum thalictroides]